MRTIWRLKCNGRSDDEGDDGLEKHGLVATCKVSLYTYFMSQLLSTKCEDYYQKKGESKARKYAWQRNNVGVTFETRKTEKSSDFANGGTGAKDNRRDDDCWLCRLHEKALNTFPEMLERGKFRITCMMASRDFSFFMYFGKIKVYMEKG